MDIKTSCIKIIDGELFPYLKDVELYGRIATNGEFFIWGWAQEHEDNFFKGMLEYDKKVQIHGYETCEDVRNDFAIGDVLICVNSGDYVEV